MHSQSLIMHTQLSSGTRGITFELSLYLYLLFVRALVRLYGCADAQARLSRPYAQLLSLIPKYYEFDNCFVSDFLLCQNQRKQFRFLAIGISTRSFFLLFFCKSVFELVNYYANVILSFTIGLVVNPLPC